MTPIGIEVAIPQGASIDPRAQFVPPDESQPIPEKGGPTFILGSRACRHAEACEAVDAPQHRGENRGRSHKVEIGEAIYLRKTGFSHGYGTSTTFPAVERETKRSCARAASVKGSTALTIPPSAP